MSNGNKRQKDKKNKNRPKADMIGFVPSIQKRYNKPINYAQEKLF